MRSHRVQGPHGNRKRSRTPSSSGSESRIAPRKPFGRHHRATERGSNNRSSHHNDDTPPGAASRRSSLGTHDEFLDDVRFDVAPKDMCIASSQDSARGDDDSVVLQQLCSLGSVLAGGKCDGAGVGEEQGGGSGSSGGSGQHSADGGNGSRGAPSRDDAKSGGSLLTRWLQPTTTAHGQGCPSRTSKTGRKSGSGLPGGGNNATTVVSGGSTGAGTRNVGDWAKKALLRKKLADAERGRRLRLQLEGGAALAGGPGGCGVASSLAPPAAAAAAAAAATAAADQRAMEAVAGSSAGSSTKESSSPPAAATDAAQAAATPATTTNEKTLPQGGSPEEAAAQGTASAAAPVTPTPTAAPTGGVGSSSGAGAKDNVITIVDEEDEYGDDFDFLTDADLQALEEQATKTAAVCSQQAASASQQHVSQPGYNSAIGTKSSQQAPPSTNWTGAGPSHSGRSNTSSNAGDGAEVGASTTPSRILSTSNTAGPRGAPQAAGLKRSFNGSAGRPPLSTIGPNPKRGGGHWQEQQQQGRATSVIAHHGGSAGSSSQSGNHGASRLSQQRRGRATPGRGEGAASNAARLQGKVLSGGGAVKATATGVASQQGPAPATGDPDLFTTYNSMEAFTRSVKPGRPKAGQASAAAGAGSDKGQARLTSWTQQPQHQPPAGTRPMVPATAAAAAAAGKGTIPSHQPDVSAGPREFNPAFVHRRFLVLEVTYVSARSGNGAGSREKVLMALEQGQKEAVTTADPAALLPAKDGSDSREGGGMAQQRKISLLEDWYDCEVEPGDVVHVLFPVAPDRVGGGDGGALSDDAEEEIFKSPHVVVDNGSGKLLVVQPDILVSPTKVADTVQCTRKAVLQSRLTSDASKSKPAVLGNLKHELFETSLLAAATAAAAAAAKSAPAWQKQGGAGAGPCSSGGDLLTSQYMAKLVDRIVVSQLEALYGAGLDEDTARRELLNVSGPILQWHRSFLARTRAGGTDSSIAGSGGNGEGGTASFNSAGARDARIAVSRVLATEDDVWSPVLGLKGIMDATVEARVQPFQAPVYGGGEGASSLVMPVEVKTGKRIGEANSSHRAQVCRIVRLIFRVV